MSNVDPRVGDEAVLREFMESLASERFGADGQLTTMVREPFRHIGSYDCEIVTASFADGTSFDVFFKDFRFTQQSKDDRGGRRDREVYVYQRLLADAGLGTAEYYGSVWGEQGRYWLFLEFVRGEAIEAPCGGHAGLAGAWLARLQDQFRVRIPQLADADTLIDMDESFFRDRAEHAIRDTRHIAPSAEGRLRDLVERYELAFDLLARQPRTLVHGGYIPWHILVDEGKDPTRVCAIDWELAGIGPSLYDLALFTDDAELSEEAKIIECYCKEANRLGLPLPTEIEQVIGCIRLHRVFDWLSRAVEKKFPEPKVVKLVHRAERIGERVL
jgi:hypothetical protein